MTMQNPVIVKPQTLATILERISVASQESPIAVLKGFEGIGAVFGNTIGMAEYLAKGPDDVIGVFDNTMNKVEVKATLQKVFLENHDPNAADLAFRKSLGLDSLTQ